MRKQNSQGCTVAPCELHWTVLEAKPSILASWLLCPSFNMQNTIESTVPHAAHLSWHTKQTSKHSLLANLSFLCSCLDSEPHILVPAVSHNCVACAPYQHICKKPAYKTRSTEFWLHAFVPEIIIIAIHHTALLHKLQPISVYWEMEYYWHKGYLRSWFTTSVT